MRYTDDPIADFLHHDAEQQARLNKLPRCSYCDEAITSDYYYEINDEIVCEECLEAHFKKAVWE